MLGDGESSVFLPRQNEQTAPGLDAMVVGWGRTDQVNLEFFFFFILVAVGLTFSACFVFERSATCRTECCEC